MQVKKQTFLNQKGQSSVEYILLMVVVISIATSVFDIIEKRFLDGPGSFTQIFLKEFSDTFGGSNGSFQGEFKHFVIRK